MIYLDHASATPVNKKALEAMTPYFSELFFNPSAPYLSAKYVREQYEDAKNTIAHAIGAKGTDLVITAGATESINLAFQVMGDPTSPATPAPATTSSITATPAPSPTLTCSSNTNSTSTAPHCLILSTEHASVRALAERHSHEEIRVNRAGVIDLDDFRQKLRPNTRLVSISLVNNELGTIQPFSEISEIIQSERQRRLKMGENTPLFLHSDASQALNLLDISVSRLGVDLLTINSAKIYGPKGVGALYVDRHIHLQPLIYGGGQERGLRSGTENVAGVIGFATAISLAKKHLSSHRKKYQILTDLLRQELSVAEVSPVFLGNPKKQLANFCPVSFPGIDAERLIYKLESEEIYLSTGAACAASKGQKSHVLAAIGLSDAEIAGSLRISLGELNDPDNIRSAGRAIVRAVNAEAQRLRKATLHE